MRQKRLSELLSSGTAAVKDEQGRLMGSRRRDDNRWSVKNLT